MPEPRLLKLDLDTERKLVDAMDHDITLGRFSLSHDKVFVLDLHGGDPGRSSLLSTLKEKLDFIDFDAGGVKILELNIRGNAARFTLVPRWEMPANGGKGLGGPSIGLKFSMSW